MPYWSYKASRARMNRKLQRFYDKYLSPPETKGYCELCGEYGELIYVPDLDIQAYLCKKCFKIYVKMRLEEAKKEEEEMKSRRNERLLTGNKVKKNEKEGG